MIGKLKGKVEELGEDSLLLDVSGVGYEIFTHARLLSALEVGVAAALMIETHVREDHIHLYGFANASEREWFRTLTSVQGVGAKMGMAILGLFDPENLLRIFASQDKTALMRVSGVGNKLAERLVTELKNKTNLGSAAHTPLKTDETNAAPPASRLLEDALSALGHLGYGRSEAFAAISKAGEAKTLDALIKASLKELAQ